MDKSGIPLNALSAAVTGGDPAAEALVAGYGEAAVLLDFQNGHVAANRHAQRIEYLFEDHINDQLAALGHKAMAAGEVVTATLNLGALSRRSVFLATVIPKVLGDKVLYLFHDQTLDHNLREALIESRQRYKDLVEVSSDFSWEVDANGLFQFVSRTGALGYTPEDLVGMRPEDLVLGADSFDPLPFVTDQVVEDVELWMHRADGSLACVLVSAMPFFEEDGTHLGVRGICRDVTQERERAAALAQAHQREQVLGYIVNTIRDEINPADMLKSAAAATARALGAQGAVILRKVRPAGEGEETDGPLSFESAAQYGAPGPGRFSETFLAFRPGERLLREDHAEGWNVLAGPCVHSGKLNGVICLWRRDDWSDDARILVGDISNQLGIAIEQISNHESIVRLSRTDAMTGLLNRRAFYDEELPRRFKRLSHAKHTGALFYVDMDNFKLVNDVKGHQAGDEAIMALRDLLYDFVRPGDLIARLGGDEFALWLDGVDEATASSRCGHLLKLSQALRVYSGSEDRPLGISVGIAVYRPESGESLQGLLARADHAMYAVKQNSKGDFRVAPPADVSPGKCG